MRLNITKGPTWTCELCHNRNNSPISTVCSICKAERPKYQFGIQIEGRYYICKVKIISFLPSISVCEVSTTKCDFFSLDVGESENTIEECIILAIKQRQQVKQKRVSIANEDSIGFPELENEELDTVPALNNAISPKKSSLKVVIPVLVIAQHLLELVAVVVVYLVCLILVYLYLIQLCRMHLQ